MVLVSFALTHAAAGAFPLRRDPCLHFPTGHSSLVPRRQSQVRGDECGYRRANAAVQLLGGASGCGDASEGRFAIFVHVLPHYGSGDRGGLDPGDQCLLRPDRRGRAARHQLRDGGVCRDLLHRVDPRPLGGTRRLEPDNGDGDAHDHSEHEHEHEHEHDDHNHGTHLPLFPGSDDCYVSFTQLRGFASRWLGGLTNAVGRWRYASWLKPDFYRERSRTEPEASEEHDSDDDGHRDLDFPTILRHVFRYGFVEIADDILFALLVGIALGGILFLAIPSDLMASEYARWLSYPVMVLIGVPLYICASASTPIAAALVAKGVSPGAALVFLMTGPATNTGTIAIIVSQFGTRFASVYVISVIAVTVALGVLIDVLLLAAGLSIAVNLEASDSPAILALQWGGAIGLAALIVWRFRAGAMRSGYDDLMLNLRPVGRRIVELWLRLTRGRGLIGAIIPNTPAGAVLLSTALVLFLGSGFTRVPPGSVGYGLLFGEVLWRDLEPGLHYLAPRPFVRVDHWPVREVKSIMSDTAHEFVSGDLNLMSFTVNVQYRVSDPYVYHYRTTDPKRVISAFISGHMRSFISARRLEPLLNVHRGPLEEHIRTLFDEPESGRDPVLNSIELVKANLVDVSPTAETASAFREVSSAQEDRERVIVNAQRFLVALTPQAYGNAFYEVQQAQGQAFRKVTGARAEAEAISAVAVATRTAPGVLRNMLWREKLESALSGNAKVIVPNEGSLDKVALWKRRSGEVGNGHQKGD